MKIDEQKCTWVFDFFFPFSPLPPTLFFWFPFKTPYKQMLSWMMLIQQSIALSCRSSFAYQPLQDQVLLSSGTVAHYVWLYPEWQCPAGVCRLPMPALPSGWSTRSRLSAEAHSSPNSPTPCCQPASLALSSPVCMSLVPCGALVIKKPCRGILLS